MSAPHVLPLTEFVHRTRAQRGLGRAVPFFDPADGGIHARVLFLLEAPGPKAVTTGFVSRDNPDPSARNLRRLLRPLSRRDTVLWNVVPWYVGTGERITPVGEQDLETSQPWLIELLRILTAVRVAVLVGRKAQRVKAEIAAVWGWKLSEMCHPSRRVFNSWPERWAEWERSVEGISRRLR